MNERDEFQQWLLSKHGLEATWSEERNCFEQFSAHLAFKAWQAARAKPVVPEWIPVSEKLPETKKVLSEKCTLEGKEIPALYRSGEVLTFNGKHVSARIVEWFDSKTPLSGVTHWMPLPEPPKGDV